MIAPESFNLSVIIPIRITVQREDILQRLAYCRQDYLLDESHNTRTVDNHNIEFIVVDDGTELRHVQDLQQRCNELGLRYLTTGVEPQQIFNLARARNHAARYAKGKLILFMDVDLKPYQGFYQDILNEAELINMNTHINQFLMCPVIYLTEQGTKYFSTQKISLRRQFAINAMLKKDDGIIEKYSHGTSVIIINRHYYLSVGGQDEAFEGWGYEDYEFTTRLMMKNPKFPIPENWESMAGNFMTINKYSGWKAAYRLHGDWLANKGIYLFHAYHQTDNNFKSNLGKNGRLLLKQLKRERDTIDPKPLTYPESGRSLLFRKNPFCYSSEFNPYWGEVLFEKEELFKNIDNLSTYLSSHKIDRIIFPNPYANKQLQAIYQWCRDNNFPFIIAERGALPDSVYHDHSGFLSDGDSYSREKWNKPLTSYQQEKVRNYINSIRTSSKMLEAQAGRQPLKSIRRKLGIKEDQKIIFVPFQQPNDTVISYFSGPIKNFENFHQVICTLSAELGDGWRVIYKKHPVENELKKVDDAICADDYNTYDLIEIADALVLINSGVGIYGMMFNKPVYIMGEAWYGIDNVNVAVENSSALAILIQRGLTPDEQLVERFIYYLRYEFYLFGEQLQRNAKLKNGAPITATLNIKYYELRPSKGVPLFLTEEGPLISSPLFDRYQTKDILTHSRNPNSLKKTSSRRKFKKFKERPVQFFIDAVKNLFSLMQNSK
jgi:predicted glycosyltransferase involved in capsule biosynthesis